MVMFDEELQVTGCSIYSNRRPTWFTCYSMLYDEETLTAKLIISQPLLYVRECIKMHHQVKMQLLMGSHIIMEAASH